MKQNGPQVVDMHRARKIYGAEPANELSEASTSTQAAGTSPQDLARMIVGIEETAYTWDVATDRLHWQENAAKVLGLATADEIATGVGLQAHIVPEHTMRWHDAILGQPAVVQDADDRGVPYRVQYRFLANPSDARSSVWIEDTGRWWPGPNKRAIRAQGTVRIVTETYLEAQRLLHSSDHVAWIAGEFNVTPLGEALAAAIARAEHTRQPSAVMIAAIDNLSSINAHFGFEIGDEVIAGVGRLLKGKLRRGDLLTRYSSNKFGIIVNDCSPSGITYAAERFLSTIRNARIETSACQVTATISVGAASIPEHATTPAQAMSVALEALDRAKSSGEHLAIYSPSSESKTARQRNIHIADDITKALAAGRMRFLLQPIVDASTGETVLHECLLRMVHTDSSLVPAGEFIAAAEELGLARQIDHCTLDMAIRLLSAHQKLRLSLNVSGLTSSDNDWLVTLHRLTAHDPGLTKRLTIEITETAMIRDLGRMAAFVDILRRQGCAVAIDDFGAGYTSFRHLTMLKLDILKLDGSFVKNLPTDPQGRVFVKSMVEVARSYGMKTVAEWVLTPEAAAFLREAGVDYLQGYLFGEPMPLEAVLGSEANRQSGQVKTEGSNESREPSQEAAELKK